MSTLSRRRLLQSGLAAAATFTLGPSFWRDALAAVPPAQPGPGPYGPLQPADANGIMLPKGFTSRVIAQSNLPVAGTGYVFPIFPDGEATFPTPDGGWILVTNSEVPGGGGGVSAIRFDAAGKITSAYRILRNTSTNCAGGPTPWGTWLSCEEVEKGQVWECDPTRENTFARPAMGVFQHEAACVDPTNQHVYLSEDVNGGGLYRFRPATYPDLSAGTLEIACGTPGQVVWKTVPDPTFAGATPTRAQVADSIRFARGEGIWFDAGIVYLATTTDETIHAYNTATGVIEVLYNADAAGPNAPLRGVDNVHVSRSGDVFVAEDSYSNDPDAMDVCIISREREVARFLKLTGHGHFMPGAQSETVGVTFDPSGKRMYLASQRYLGTGIVYEISGPFRLDRPSAPPPPPAPGRNAPIGIDVSRRLSVASLVGQGLAVGLTLDTAARVRVRITARLTRNGRRRTVTLATLTRSPGRGHSTLRVKPGKAMAKLLHARRRALTATVEVRITTPGSPAQTFKRTVSLRP